MRSQLFKAKVAGGKCISKTKSKQQSPCSNFMHRPVVSMGNTCMYWPVTCTHRHVISQADVCTYCMGSKVSSLSQIYLYSSYFGSKHISSQKIHFFKTRVLVAGTNKAGGLTRQEGWVNGLPTANSFSTINQSN